MKRSFFYFAWRELTRSANFRKNMAAKGVLIFLALYFSLVALLMGFNLNEYLAKDFPGQSQLTAFNSLIFINRVSAIFDSPGKTETDRPLPAQQIVAAFF